MQRVLSFRDLVLIAAASIGPAFSLATTLGPMAASGASATPLALLAITAIMACIAIGYRRLGERHPNAGSSYTWVALAFGPAAGAYAAWILIVANIFAIVATSAPAGAYTLALLAPALPPSPALNAAIGAVWVLGAGALLWRGMAPTSRVANVFAIAELCVLVVAAVVACLTPPVAHAATLAPPPDLAGFAGALVLGIWMIDGWEVSASTAEEAMHGKTAPGAGGLLGLALTAAVLWFCMAAFLRVGTPAGFDAHEGDALAYVGGGLGGVWRGALTVTVLVSLAAAMQATLIYLSRSLFAMGRDGVLPAALGRLDRREQPALAVALLTGIGITCTLASGLSPSIHAAFAFILDGTSVFLGVLFVISAAAAACVFWRDPDRRISGVLLPAAGALALVVIIVFSIVRAEAGTRAFELVAALAGLPLALWRGRAWHEVAPG